MKEKMTTQSLLRLERFRVERVVIAEIGTRMLEEESDVRIDFDVRKFPGQWEFEVMLEITSEYVVETVSRTYTSQIRLVGAFRLPDDLEEKQVRGYVPVLCLTNLYGTARGLIANASGGFPGGPFILPLIDMFKAIEETNARRVVKQKKSLISESTEKKPHRKRSTPKTRP